MAWQLCWSWGVCPLAYPLQPYANVVVKLLKILNMVIQRVPNFSGIVELILGYINIFFANKSFVYIAMSCHADPVQQIIF